jgi:glycosyltransferase involved in cell wall biosynthesis
MNNLPKISVVMTFYNCQKFIGQAIESILNQTFKDFELILIDDASTDGTAQIAKKYLSDERVIYIRNEVNQGAAYNSNQGLKLARAEIIARLDGDDYSAFDRLEKQYDFLMSHPEIAAVGSYFKIINEAGKIIDQRTKPTDFEKIKKDAIVYMPLIHPAVMYKKSAVLAVGGYRVQYAHISDGDLWYRLVYSGYQTSNLQEFLLFYRYHQGSTAHAARFNAKLELKLRYEIIAKFRLKLTLGQWFLIYLQFLVGYLFSGRARQKIEGWYKIIFNHGQK